MAELSVDEAQRLARLFLTGQAGDAEVQRLQNALTDDQGAALELLAQMQAALDDSAPAGLNAEQDRTVNGRIEALIAPRVKKRGFFAFILKLFKGKPKPTEEESQSKSRRRRRGGAAEPEAPSSPAPAESAPAHDAMAETLPGGGDGMEEMAPIAAAPPAESDSNASVGAGSPRPAPAPAESAAKRGLPAWLAPALIVLVLAAVAAYGVRWFLGRPKTKTPVPVVAPAPTPAATAVPAMPTAPKPSLSPTPAGQGHRALAVGAPNSKPLPAEIPATTPVPAGQWPKR
jgi:hypothetical protein